FWCRPALNVSCSTERPCEGPAYERFIGVIGLDRSKVSPIPVENWRCRNIYVERHLARICFAGAAARIRDDFRVVEIDDSTPYAAPAIDGPHTSSRTYWLRIEELDPGVEPNRRSVGNVLYWRIGEAEHAWEEIGLSESIRELV